MNERERILAAINYRPPDQVPYLHSFAPSAWKYERDLLGVLNAHPDDFREGPYTEADIQKPDPADFKDGQYCRRLTDNWGCTREYHNFGLSGMVVEPFVLADTMALKTFQPPPPPVAAPDNPEFTREHDHQRRYRRDHYAVTLFLPTFERMHYLRGYQQILVDIAVEDPFVEELLEVVVENNLGWLRWAIATEAEAVIFSDDWGTQNGLMINPTVWRTIFKPRYCRMFETVRQAGMDVWMHSDGVITEILPDLAEIGVKVLWPQFSCYDLADFAGRVRALRLAVLADFDRQNVLPFGTPAEIAAYVQHVLDLFHARQGGFIGRAELSGDMPFENIRALLAAFWKYGRAGNGGRQGSQCRNF